MKKLLLILLFMNLLVSCSTPAPRKGAAAGEQLTNEEFREVFSKYTRNDKKFDGFNQQYDVHVTLVGSQLQSAILQKESDTYLWDEQRAQEEREKMLQENTNSTKFVIIMYTPNVRLNDLHRPGTIWETILEVNGQRYRGKISKVSGPIEKLAPIYPTFNRFTRAYEVIFDIPLTATEDYEATFILASELGTSIFKYGPEQTLR